MFGITGGYHGVDPTMGREVLTGKLQEMQNKSPAPNVFGVLPFNDSYQTGKTFSDVLASRFRTIEESIAQRRMVSEFVSGEPAGLDLLTDDDIHATWQDVKYAVDAMFSDERFVKPVQSLWEVDNYHGVHCVDVALAGLALAAGSDIYAGKKDNLIVVGIAGLLHDVGKEIYPELYTKIGEFNEDDHRLMKQHTSDSVALVKNAVNRLPEQMGYAVLRGIEEHHENWDGTGYPFGYKRDEISKAAQVIRIADSMESGTSIIRAAMYNGRAKNQSDIMQDISSKSGTWYSPYFVRVLQRGFDQYMIEQRKIGAILGEAPGSQGPKGPIYHA